MAKDFWMFLGVVRTFHTTPKTFRKSLAVPKLSENCPSIKSALRYKELLKSTHVVLCVASWRLNWKTRQMARVVFHITLWEHKRRHDDTATALPCMAGHHRVVPRHGLLPGTVVCYLGVCSIGQNILSNSGKKCCLDVMLLFFLWWWELAHNKKWSGLNAIRNAHGFYAKPKCLSMPPTPEDIAESRVFREKFRSVHVGKGVWSLLTDLFLSRQEVFLHHLTIQQHALFFFQIIAVSP